MKIHQILITEEGKLPDINSLPEKTLLSIQSIKKAYEKDCDYKLYSGNELEKIISENFSESVYLSYKKILPFACKSDLARACLLYLHGGIYFDLHLNLINKIPLHYLKQWIFCAFRDTWPANMNTFAVSNSIIYCEEGCPIIKKYIDLIVENCKNEYYGIQPISQTGPSVLGRAYNEVVFEKKINKDVSLIGGLEPITPDKLIINNSYVSNSGIIVAIKREEENFTEMGIVGTNDYVEFFKKGNFYNKSIIIKD